MPAEIHAEQLTHINLAFAHIDADGRADLRAGRGFAGVIPVNNGVNQPYQRFEGEHSYAELVAKYIGKQGFVRYWDENAQAPYLWNESSRTFISYDDPQSIGIKVRFAQAHGLGGVMFWELSQDRDGELLNVINHPGPGSDASRSLSAQQRPPH